ncbi:MAG: biotin transporter BioY [Natronomonas sp.]
MTDIATNDVDLVPDATVRNLARSALFAALIAAFAYVSAPWPLSPGVPVTLQVLGVFLAGIFLGPAWGGASMVLYLTAGALGAPVFSGGTSGIGILLAGTPTFGFLWSYPPAAALVGLVVHGGFDLHEPEAVWMPRLVAAMLAGIALIYGLGTLGFAYVTGAGVVASLLAAALPFVPAELLKMIAAIAIVRSDAIRAT